LGGKKVLKYAIRRFDAHCFQFFLYGGLTMSRKCFQQVCFSLILGAAWCGCPWAANAEWLGAYGDFASNWTYNDASYFSLSTAAQSPFTNAYANNSKGLDVSTQSINKYFKQSFTTTATTGLLLYLNVDFCNVTTGSGQYSIAAAYNTGSGIASLLRISSDGVYLNSDVSSLLTPVTGTWYNVQLTLDMTAKTYSGTVTAYGGSSVTFSNEPFYTNMSSYGVNGLFSDYRSSSSSAATPEHYIDNFGLSTTPISAVPEPCTMALMANGLLVYGWRRWKRTQGRNICFLTNPHQ
jgi:hypothetical protein